MSHDPSIDGVLVTWGERLFYPRNRIVKGDAPPRLVLVRVQVWTQAHQLGDKGINPQLAW